MHMAEASFSKGLPGCSRSLVPNKLLLVLPCSLKVYFFISDFGVLSCLKYQKEGLPEVLGSKGTWPISAREQGNKDKIS